MEPQRQDFPCICPIGLLLLLLLLLLRFLLASLHLVHSRSWHFPILPLHPSPLNGSSSQAKDVELAGQAGVTAAFCPTNLYSYGEPECQLLISHNQAAVPVPASVAGRPQVEHARPQHGCGLLTRTAVAPRLVATATALAAAVSCVASAQCVGSQEGDSDRSLAGADGHQTGDHETWVQV